MAAETSFEDLGRLDPAIEKVEFKLTIHAAEEAKVQRLLRREHARPQRRTVYFYDTLQLALLGANLVLRSRVTDGEADDSTVKLRPADLSDAGTNWRRIAGIRIELDVVGDKKVPSAKLDGAPERGEIEQVAGGQRPPRALFSAKQERLFKDQVPHEIALDDLTVLGPVDARKWELESPEGFPHRLGIEEWSLPDATHFIELSFKVDRAGAQDAQTDFRQLLARLEINLVGDQLAKTPRVLRFFADR